MNVLVVVDVWLCQKEGTDGGHERDETKDEKHLRLGECPETIGSYQIAKYLRRHVEHPEVAKEEAFGLLSGTVRHVLALTHPLYSLAKAIYD